MTPEQVLGNVAALITALLTPLAIIAAVVAVLVYGISKVTDSPNMTRWAKSSGIAAIVLYGGNAAIGLLQNISGRVMS